MKATSRFLRSVSGSVTLMVAIGLPVMLVAAGVAIDFVRAMEQQGSAQADIDGASLAAARAFVDHGAETPAQLADIVRRRALAALESSGTDFEDSLKIEVNVAAKRVDISADLSVATSFLSLVAIDRLDRPIHSAAVAEVEDQPICILALRSDDGTGIEFSGQGEMKAKDCVVWSNSTGSQSVSFDGNGKVSASRICAVGRAGTASRFAVRPEPESGCSHVDDPMDSWAAPSVGDCTYTIDGWVSRTTAVLNPGVYCGGLRVNAKNILLKPGLYVIKDGPLILRGDSKISGKNVGIFLAGEDSRLDIDGKSKVDIHAAESGPMAGIVIASSPSAERRQSSISGRSDLKIGGVIYLPTHEITYWGESDTLAQSPVTTIIGYAIEIGGDAFLEVMNNRKKAKYAPIVSTGNGSVQLVR